MHDAAEETTTVAAPYLTKALPFLHPARGTVLEMALTQRGVLMPKKCTAEFVGTFWLVFGGCGSAVLAAAFPDVGIGLHGVSLAFGLTVLTMAYAIGHISGCHL